MLYLKLTTLPLLVLCSVFCCGDAFADEAAPSDSVTQKVKVRVQSAADTDAGDGEIKAKTSVRGRIVIVGPDGERKEYDLDDKLDLKLGVNGIANGMMISRVEAAAGSHESRYMIGVVCEPAGKVLRSHLKLDGTGLVVSRLSEKMPAAIAGLKEGDVLIAVNGNDLNDLNGLVSAVGECNAQPLTFRRIHNGEASDIVVTPVKSNSAELRAAMTAGAEAGLLSEKLDSVVGQPNSQLEMLRKLAAGNNGLMIQSFGPGIQLDDAEDFEKKFAEMLTEARKMTAKSGVRLSSAAGNASKEAGMLELKRQIEKNRAELIELREKLKSFQSDE